MANNNGGGGFLLGFLVGGIIGGLHWPASRPEAWRSDACRADGNGRCLENQGRRDRSADGG